MTLKSFFLFIVALCLLQPLCAQLKLVDSLSQEPVVAANIFSADGVLIAVSDTEGQVSPDALRKVNSNSVTVQHVAYQNKILSGSVFRSSTVVYLTPRRVEIGEVQVFDKSKYDYLVLKGYFRKQDLWNNKTRYFYDGLLTYYIPLHKKGKLRRELQAYRLFANKESTDEFAKMMGWLIDPPSLIGLRDPYSVMQDLPKGCVLVKEGDKFRIQQDGLNMGYVQRAKTGDVQVYFDRVPPQTVLSRRIFRLRGQAYRILKMEHYSDTELEKPALENLISKTGSHIGAIQRNKEYGYVPYENFVEFYVMERDYLTEAEVKERKDTFTKSIYMEEKSNYQEKFWLDLDRYGIPPLAEGIAKQLGQELIEY